MAFFIKNREKRHEIFTAYLSGRLKTGMDLLFCAATGSLYATIFAGTDWSWLAWFGIVPLCWLILHGSSKHAFLLTFVWGYCWCLFSFMWLREIFFFIPFLLSPVLAFFPACWGALVPFLYRNFMIPPEIRLKGSEAILAWQSRNPFKEVIFAMTLAAFWCFAEWVRSWIFTGLPWNLLGVSQWKMLPLVQLARYTGVYGISFLIVLVNISLTLFLHQLWFARSEPGKKRIVHSYSLLFSLALVYLCIVGIGVRNLRQMSRDKKVRNMTRIGVVQPKLSQRRSGGISLTEEAIQVCTDLTAGLIRKYPGKEAPALIAWPESAVPVPYNAVHPLSGEFRKQIAGLTFRSGIPILTGAMVLEANPDKADGVDVYNSALLLRNGGVLAARYDKVHIVPYGEYVPFSRYIPKLVELFGMGRDLSRGKKFQTIELNEKNRFGMMICYEDIFPYIARAQALEGANILMVITNDAWYPTSNEPVQHFANSVFRAVETGLPMIRIGNYNYSAVIEPSGRISDALTRDNAGRLEPGRAERCSGVLTVRSTLSPVPTFYTRHGNLFIGVCVCWVLIVLAFTLLNWRIFHRTFQQTMDSKSKKDGCRH